MNAPRQNHGFIYILSNPAMPGLHKVGLTTKPIETRLQQLNSTTSVPSPFKAERLFEIEARFLPSVERLAHRKLRERGAHYGKEFFRVDLQTGTTLVQDVIYELTGSTFRDLVGAAQERRAMAAAKTEAARQEMAEREKELESLNESVSRQRAEWVRSVKHRKNPPHKHPTLQKLSDIGAMLIGIPFIVLLVAAIFSIAGPTGLLVGALIVWWIVSLDEKSGRDNEAQIEREALERFPPKTLEDLESKRLARGPLKKAQRPSITTVSRASKVIREKTDRAIHGRNEISRTLHVRTEVSGTGTPNREGSQTPADKDSPAPGGCDHARKKWRYFVSEDVLQHIASGQVFKGMSFYFDPLGVNGFVIRDKKLPLARTNDVEFCREAFGMNPGTGVAVERGHGGSAPKGRILDCAFGRDLNGDGGDDSTPKQQVIDDEPESPYEYAFVKGAKVKRLKRSDS